MSDRIVKVPHHDVVRNHNLRAVAGFVRARGQASRKEIGDALLLNKVTVSSLVGELITRGLLENGNRLESAGPGRPSTAVRIGRERHASIVVEILADHVHLSAWALSRDRILEHDLSIQPGRIGPADTLRALAEALVRMVRQLEGAGRQVVGAIVAVPGLVDQPTGRLLVSSPLGWKDVDISRVLTRRRALAEIRIEVGRIANLATVAEWRELSDRTDLVCLHGGETGLGAGIVVGGSLLTGNGGRAGELHFTTSADAARRRSGDLGLAELLRRSGVRPSGSVDDLVRRLDAGAAPATKAVAELVTSLADRLATLVALLDPATVVLAGYLADLGDHLHVPLWEALAKALDPRPLDGLELRYGVHGPEATSVGGAILLADRAFELSP